MKTVASWSFAGMALVFSFWATELFYNLVSTTYQELYPFPGLYFIEIRLMGLLAFVPIIFKSPHTAKLPWNLVGLYLPLIILGIWSIGTFLIPSALTTLLLAIILSTFYDISLKSKLLRIFFSAVGQTVIMYTVIQLYIS